MSSLIDSMPHECSILNTRYRKDSAGGRKSKGVVVSTEVPCWEQSAGANEVSKHQKEGQRVTRKVYFRDNPRVTQRHRIIITKRSGTDVAEADQVELHVVGDPLPDSSVGYGILYKVMCVELTSEGD